MKRLIAIYVITLVSMHSGVFMVHASSAEVFSYAEGPLCYPFGWIVKPFGLCQPVAVLSPQSASAVPGTVANPVVPSLAAVVIPETASSTTTQTIPVVASQSGE